MSRRSRTHAQRQARKRRLEEAQVRFDADRAAEPRVPELRDLRTRWANLRLRGTRISFFATTEDLNGMIALRLIVTAGPRTAVYDTSAEDVKGAAQPATTISSSTS